MRLKVSPKSALDSIDKLVYEGFDLQRDYGSDLVSSSYANPIKNEDRKKINDWHTKCVRTLRKIFLDFTPVYFFWKAIEDEEIEASASAGVVFFDGHNDKYYAQMLRGGLKTLGEYYSQLTDQVFTPLFYITDKAQICFFASVCPLEPSSNEDAVCRFLFGKYNYHEWVEMEDIYVGAFGGNSEEYDTQAKTKIESAYDGLNKKTNEDFGFPLLKKRKNMIALNLPSRFLREDTHKMAS
ncbi:MAG: hypothetical protein KBA81_06580 [Rhabdochlamydiaceae bacterium]|nr:hypothetical protein [Rhabdochlamydiaceae bacterium]MBP9773108.1 hypothetical protein [Candidatus Peribacteraceae bacterium]